MATAVLYPDVSIAVGPPCRPSLVLSFPRCDTAPAPSLGPLHSNCARRRLELLPIALLRCACCLLSRHWDRGQASAGAHSIQGQCQPKQHMPWPRPNHWQPRRQAQPRRLHPPISPPPWPRLTAARPACQYGRGWRRSLAGRQGWRRPACTSPGRPALYYCPCPPE